MLRAVLLSESRTSRSESRRAVGAGEVLEAQRARDAHVALLDEPVGRALAEPLLLLLPAAERGSELVDGHFAVAVDVEAVKGPPRGRRLGQLGDGRFLVVALGVLGVRAARLVLPTKLLLVALLLHHERLPPRLSALAVVALAIALVIVVATGAATVAAAAAVVAPSVPPSEPAAAQGLPLALLLRGGGAAATSRRTSTRSCRSRAIRARSATPSRWRREAHKT